MKTNNLSEAKIIAFINSYYTPYIIRYVISKELKKHECGQVSLFGALTKFEKNRTSEDSEELIKTMCEFVEAATIQVFQKKEIIMCNCKNIKNGKVQSIFKL